MLAVLFASALGLTGDVPTHLTTGVSAAQAAYRDCIADSIAGAPEGESADQALAAALGQCRDAELALRRACKAVPGASAADTLAIVLDTRLDGEEAGLKRRDAH